MNSVAVVMPVYNEADGIAEFLMEIDESLAGVTVIVVDDCSTDMTVKIVESLIRVISLRRLWNSVSR